jgi:hypothetical protein
MRKVYRLVRKIAELYIRVYPDLSDGIGPWCDTKAKVMQTAAYLHHHVPDTVFPQTDRVFDNSTAFDTTDDVFGHDPPLSNRAIVSFLPWCQFATLGLLEWTSMPDTRKHIAQKAQVVD